MRFSLIWSEDEQYVSLVDNEGTYNMKFKGEDINTAKDIWKLLNDLLDEYEKKDSQRRIEKRKKHLEELNLFRTQQKITQLLDEIDDLEENQKDIKRLIESKTNILEKYFRQKQMLNGRYSKKYDERTANLTARRIMYKLRSEQKEVNMTNAKIAIIKIEEEKGPLYPNYDSIVEELDILIDKY